MRIDLKCIFITLPQRDRPSEVPPFVAMAVINSLRKAGYKDTFLYNIDILRPSREDAVDYIVNYNPEILCISAPVSTGYAGQLSKEWIENYNNDYPHSSLNYSTPSEYEKEHLLITNKF